MSWIDEAANKHRIDKASRASDEARIDESGFWKNLLRQIETDVELINSNPSWQAERGGALVEVLSRTRDAGMDAVFKITHPIVTITLEGSANDLTLIRDIPSGVDKKEFPLTEEVSVVVIGDAPKLSTNKGPLNVAAASQHVLGAVIAALSRR